MERIGDGCFCGAGVEGLLLPDTLREIGNSACWCCTNLKNVAFAPGSRLERIGYDCFGGAGIERIAIPRGVTEIQRGTFEDCVNLKEVVFEEGSRLEAIGNGCFASAGLEEITLPRTLKEIGAAAFRDCGNLKAIYVEDGCEASLCDAKVSESAQVGPLKETMIGNTRVWDLRKLKHVIIPDGTEKIGNRWFWGTEIERVEVPASVREICAEVFYGCKKLREVTFAEGSELKAIGLRAFYGSGLESFTAPRSLRALGQGAFGHCESIRHVRLNEGLEVLGTDDYSGACLPCGVFQGSSVERVVLPSTLKRVERHTFYGCKSLRSTALPDGLEFVG